MRIHTLLLAASAVILAACSKTAPVEDYAAFVNQKIGTGGHGQIGRASCRERV